MRYKAVFSVFGRSLASGRVVFYYQCYDETGRRTYARSTGKTKKTEATAYCMRLFREGALIPKTRVPVFRDFSDGWFDEETCGYVKWRRLHGGVTRSTLAAYKINLTNHLKPFFDGYRLDGITPLAVENWLAVMAGKGLKNASINSGYHTLKVMMGEAVRRNFITVNPLDRVKHLRVEDKAIEVFTLGEVRRLFPADWNTVWDNYLVYMANRLAAVTGMRIGEVLGLRGEWVFDDYLSVRGQYTKYGYGATKTKTNRDIPITRFIRGELQELLDMNGGGYIFSADGGEKPVSRTLVYAGFKGALEKIGIGKAERERRGLTVHGWRHFLNTTLRMANVADSKVQKVTGHKSMKMTDRYTHFDSREFTEVRAVQAELLEGPAVKGRGGKTAAGRRSGGL